jgi:hypothetical protein
MSKIFKTAAALAIGVLTLAGAQAAPTTTITFGGQNATDGSGKTSNLVWAGNMMPVVSGLFIETFDTKTANAALPPGLTTSQLKDPLVPGSNNVFVQPSNGCGFNSYNTVDVSVTGGGFGIQKGSTPNVAATPANNSTCFGFGPAPAGTPQNPGPTPQVGSTVRVDYANFLNQLALINPFFAGAKINYIGFYYGSIDTYNEIRLFNAGGLVSGAAGSLVQDGIISGTEILNAQGGTSGNQTQNGSNQYLNVNFADSETFTAFEFRTTGVAFELDNVVIGLTKRVEISEPGILGLAGLGLVGMGLAMRRRRAAV